MSALEAVHTIAALEAFSADAYLERLRDELTPAAEVSLDALDAADAGIRAALDAIDRFAIRCMKLRLDVGLADDASVPLPFRKTIGATVLQYEGDLDTLRARAASVTRDPQPIVDAAERTLAARAALRDGVLVIARTLAEAYLPGARARARNATVDDDRARWTAAMNALEDLLGQARTEPGPPDEGPTRGELLEWD